MYRAFFFCVYLNIAREGMIVGYVLVIVFEILVWFLIRFIYCLIIIEVSFLIFEKNGKGKMIKLKR